VIAPQVEVWPQSDAVRCDPVAPFVVGGMQLPGCV
jgi:hypothetical protein